jgi:protein-tyrosine sulfotransferase
VHTVTRDPARRRSDATDNTPVVVLTYAKSGADRLRSVLAAHPDLSCTSGTGLLSLCEQAARTWQIADKREELSALAMASTRALASTVMTSILASAGGPRWCEITTASASCAETFVRLYPRTRFLCLHRHCADVIYSGLKASPWGLADSAFWPFTQRFPGNSVATIAAYWAARTEPLLEFQRRHPDRCHRVRYEDLVTDPGTTANEIRTFLCLAADGSTGPAWPAGDQDGDITADTADAPGCGAKVPAGMIPGVLLDQVNKLLAGLGYTPLISRQSEVAGRLRRGLLPLRNSRISRETHSLPHLGIYGIR